MESVQTFAQSLADGTVVDLRLQLIVEHDWSPDVRDIATGLNAFLGRLLPDLRTLEAAVDSASTIGRSTELLANVADDAASQATHAEQILVAVRESASGAQNVSELSQRSHDIAVALHASSSESITTIYGSLEKLDSVESESALLRDTVTNLERRVTEIATLTKSIKEIADRTNLLSLNATIEAARAGDYGHGFGVVAEEIRKLADSAAVTTKQIAAVVRDVREATIVTRTQVETNSHAVSEIATDGRSIRASLEQMAELVGEATQAIGSIAHVSEQQSEALSSIALTVHEAKESALKGASRAERLRGLGAGELNFTANRVFARYRTGSIADRMYDHACALASDVEGALEPIAVTLEKRGASIFATDYRELKGSEISRLSTLFDVRKASRDGFSPQKFFTSWDAETDAALADIVDRPDYADPAIVIAGIVDLNGYLTMQRKNFRKDITGDEALDRVGNRVKRFFEEIVELRAARVGLAADSIPRRAPRSAFVSAGIPVDEPGPAHRPFIVQTYARDTGEIMNDLSVPVFVAGRRWGAIRLCYLSDAAGVAR